MDIEEAKKRLEFLKWQINRPPKHTTDDTSNYEDARAIEAVLNELEKKDKLIHKLADTLRYYQKGEQEFCYDICDKAYVKCECKDEECIKNIIKKAEEIINAKEVEDEEF